MKLSDHPILKKEILALPPKEKDRLLLRLVAKDKVLTEHLHFTLLENESDLTYRVEEIKETILSTMIELKAHKKLNAKEVLTSLRKLAKLVNHFFKVTKANFEELELKIFLFNNTIIQFKSMIFSSYRSYEDLLANYFVRQTLISLRKFDKLHEDLRFDLAEDVNLLLKKIYSGYMADIAIDLKLPKEV